MCSAVIFDMDGVLTDTEPVINAAALAALKEFEVDARPEDFTEFVGTGEDRYIGGVAEMHGHRYDPVMKKRTYEIYLDILPDMVNPIPGVHDLLQRLREQAVPLAVATSADHVKMKANLAAVNVPLDWFRVIVTGEDIDNKKPSPDIYLHTAGRLSLAPSECCVVEDAVNGVLAAKAAGMRCVAVTGSFHKDALRAVGADCVRDRIAEVTLEDLGIANVAG